MTAYFVATAVLAGIVHPVCVNWVWSDAGWLSMLNVNGANESTVAVGMLDFGGAGVVHLCGGVSALVGAIMVGPRDGRFVNKKDDDYDLERMHSGPLPVPRVLLTVRLILLCTASTTSVV